MCRFFCTFIVVKQPDMLPLQQTIQFSAYTELYDLIIPQDNLLRRINDLVDFSFIQKELMDKYSHDNGRMAESPVMMFKYLLLKTIYDISDVDVVERSRYDMSFKYFLGMTPENTDLINPSSLCKFRKLRLKDKDLLNLLIGKTVEIAVEKGIIKSRTIIVDATHTGSRSNPYSPVEILRLRSKQLRKSIIHKTKRATSAERKVQKLRRSVRIKQNETCKNQVVFHLENSDFLTNSEI